MIGCRVCGLETVTWKCNWNCVHCYFRRFDDMRKNVDTAIDDLKVEIDAGKARGCDKVVLAGKGEPMLHKEVHKIIEYCTYRQTGLSSHSHTTPVAGGFSCLKTKSTDYRFGNYFGISPLIYFCLLP